MHCLHLTPNAAQLRKAGRPDGCRLARHRPSAVAYPVVLEPPERSLKARMSSISVDGRPSSGADKAGQARDDASVPKHDRKRRRARRKKKPDQDSMVCTAPSLALKYGVELLLLHTDPPCTLPIGCSVVYTCDIVLWSIQN